MVRIFRSIRSSAFLTYVILLIAMFCMTAIAQEELKIGTDAPNFRLKNAEDKNYNLKKMKGNVVILIMGNRETRKETDKWAQAIKKDYAKNKKLKVFMIADMRSVPWFIPKGFIKGWLKKDKPPVKLLLDWNGKAHAAYKTKKKKANVFIISQKGKIVYLINANYNDKVYKKVTAEIEKNFDANQVSDNK